MLYVDTHDHTVRGCGLPDQTVALMKNMYSSHFARLICSQKGLDWVHVHSMHLGLVGLGSSQSTDTFNI